MKYNLPAIEEYEKLLPVARQIYEHNSQLSWELLLPLFLVSVAIGYSSDLGISGAVLVRLKRLILVVVLLLIFPMIAEFAQIIGVEIAKSIDDMTGIDMVLDAAAKNAHSLSFDLKSLFGLTGDFILGGLVLISFIILVLARFLLLAFQHFYWFLLVAMGPFLILGMLFESSSGITKGLFKNMFQVSAWPVVWSILSAFLKALPFSAAYSDIGGFVTIITLNLIIAVALLFSPFLVSQLCEGVNLSVGDTLRKGALRTVAVATGPKGIAVASAARGVAAKGQAAYAASKEAKLIRKSGMKWS